VLTREQQEALIAEIQRRQQNDGGWSLHALGPWRWSHQWRFRPPGTPDALLWRVDGPRPADRYTLRKAGLRAIIRR